MSRAPRSLPWLQPGEPFPPVASAWADDDPAPGLLAGGGALDVSTLQAAYARGIFPWFSEGQPILWWSPDPRMVLDCSEFRLHRSLRKTLQRFRAAGNHAIRIDTAFERVMRACASTPRPGQSGTWIHDAMHRAYCELHERGLAHSVETWIDGELVGGLYCVGLGGAVFGESMFSHRTDASKIALAALVALCRQHQVGWIDCQQQTHHLASLGARPVTRPVFVERLGVALQQTPPLWQFKPLYWNWLIPTSMSGTEHDA